METFSVDQAIFASSDRGAIQGYQLVAKSPGVDRFCSQTLCRWAPTQLPADAPGQWTLNYFGISDTAVAVTRTLQGGPEYSGRGGTQVVTLILVLSDDQFASYDYHPLAVARTAMTLGLLRLPPDLERQQIPAATLPRYPLVDPCLVHREDADELGPLLDELVHLILESRRVAVIGLADPLGAIERLLPMLPRQTRRQFSFTTGLAPTSRRPFQAHFLPSLDPATRRVLQSQDIVCLGMGQPSIAASLHAQ